MLAPGVWSFPLERPRGYLLGRVMENSGTIRAALKDKRWPVFAGKTITVRESCMPGISCSVSPATFGRARSRPGI
jgi:hypothetical protein